MKQILCLGHSNTYGLIPGTTNQRYGWGTRWTSILDDKVRTKGYRVIEEGLAEEPPYSMIHSVQKEEEQKCFRQSLRATDQ